MSRAGEAATQIVCWTRLTNVTIRLPAVLRASAAEHAAVSRTTATTIPGTDRFAHLLNAIVSSPYCCGTQAAAGVIGLPMARFCLGGRCRDQRITTITGPDFSVIPAPFPRLLSGTRTTGGGQGRPEAGASGRCPAVRRLRACDRARPAPWSFGSELVVLPVASFPGPRGYSGNDKSPARCTVLAALGGICLLSEDPTMGNYRLRPNVIPVEECLSGAWEW